MTPNDPDRTPQWVWLLFTHAAAFGFGVIAEAMRQGWK
jgi:hypothetical protein